MVMMDRQHGFTYLAVLFMIALMGVMLASVATIWHTARQREKERELLFVGNQFRLAIGGYYEKTPGALKKYPSSLDELLKDGRFVTMQRHLRRVYRDPMTGNSEWGIVKSPQGGIMGIHSLSQDTPLKTGNFRAIDKGFEGKQKYSEWVFYYTPKPPGQASIKQPQPATSQ
jgi:type II secretory pathway pseudopilin PulG